MRDEYLIRTLKFFRDHRLTRVLSRLGESLVHSQVMILLNVESTLLHQDFEGGLVLLAEVNTRLRHILVNDL